jgi:hypothetical protein
MIYSVSEAGDMVDFLKANPFISLETYMWGVSVPMIRLMALDYTRAKYLSDEEVAMKIAKDIDLDNLNNDFGVPLFE